MDPLVRRLVIRIALRACGVAAVLAAAAWLLADRPIAGALAGLVPGMAASVLLFAYSMAATGLWRYRSAA